MVAMIVCAALAFLPREEAHAADGQKDADVRCVAVGLRMIEMTAPEQRTAGMMLAVYYLGRLDGKASDLDVERLVKAEAAKMTSADFRADAVRCGQEMQQKGSEIQRIGSSLWSQDQSK
jgi:hypothetical protein